MSVILGANDRVLRQKLAEITKNANASELKAQIKQMANLALTHPHGVKLLEENIPGSPLFNCYQYSFGISDVRVQNPAGFCLDVISPKFWWTSTLRKSAQKLPETETTYFIRVSRLSTQVECEPERLNPTGVPATSGVTGSTRYEKIMAIPFGSIAISHGNRLSSGTSFGSDGKRMRVYKFLDAHFGVKTLSEKRGWLWCMTRSLMTAKTATRR